MATIDVKNLDGKTVGESRSRRRVFGVEVNEHLLWEVVKAQRAKRRAGTHATKRRDEVRGGGKKPYKQKGTGHARQGSTRAPHCVGGGKVLGPKPRDYEYHLPKKAMAGALRSALSLRAKEQKLIIVDELHARGAEDQAGRRGARGAGRRHGAGRRRRRTRRSRKSTRNLQHAKYLAARGAQRLRRARSRDAGHDARRRSDARHRAPQRRSAHSGRCSMTRAAHHIIKRPLLTEKGTRLKEHGGAPVGTFAEEELKPQVLFEVALEANKIEIKTRRREALHRSRSSTSARRSCAARRSASAVHGPPSQLEEGDRDAGRGRQDRVLRGSLSQWASRPTSRRRRAGAA